MAVLGARAMMPEGHDLTSLFSAAPEQSHHPLAVQLVGRTYQVNREGHTGSFTIVFQAGGHLVVQLDAQVIMERWQPSTQNQYSVILGGCVMPAAEVVIGHRILNNDPNELWEPSPPMGAPRLVGTWQQDSGGITAVPAATLATRLELIIDRSGSMEPLHAATVSGLNHFLREHRTLPHANTISMRLVVFDNVIETPWPEGTPLNDLSRTVTPAMVKPRGQTALLDAIGTILSGAPLVPMRVVCIVTDGYENSSRQYTRSQVNNLITKRKEAGWTFIFLAANQDAIAEGATLGIEAGNCATFSATPAGLYGSFGSASAASNRGSLFGNGASAFSNTERAACFGGSGCN